MGRRVKIGAAAALAVTMAALVLVILDPGTHAPKPHHHKPPPTTQDSTTATTAPPPQPVWRMAWGSAMAWGFGTATEATARELATIPVAGEAVRVRISNLYGNAPLQIGAATVAESASGPAAVADTLQPLYFNGQAAVTVPVGGLVYSDPVYMPVTGGETLAVSLFITAADVVTLHPCCTRIVSYASPNGGGDLTGSVSGQGLSVTSPWERWVDAVDVLQTTGQGSIVVVGDSITDGYNATARWTDALQQRIDTLPAAQQRAVVNEAITANALTSVVRTDADTGGGPSGLARMATDAIEQAGVSEIVLFLGTNDLWFGASAAQLIQGFEQAIAGVHQADLRIIGVTLLPRSTNPEELWTPTQEAELEQVNSWILGSGAFDGVLNLAPSVANVYGGACVPTMMYPPYDSGDHLHPNAAGQTAMADAIDPSVLELPPLPQVPPLLAVQPTPGCTA